MKNTLIVIDELIVQIDAFTPKVQNFLKIPDQDGIEIESIKKEISEIRKTILAEIFHSEELDSIITDSEIIFLDKISQIELLASRLILIYNKYFSIYSEMEALVQKLLSDITQVNIESNILFGGSVSFLLKKIFHKDEY